MLKRLRVLPVLIVFAFASFGVKVGGLWNEAERFIGLAVPGAHAAETTGAEEDQFVNDEDGEQRAPETGSDSGDDDALAALDESTKTQQGQSGGRVFTEAEVNLLQDLGARRELLEARTRELDFRANLLEAAEQRIEVQISELKKIEAKINGLIQQHDEQEEGKLRSLVRVYETMKPKQAARIFNNLDLDILLDVAELMSERRLAPVLAAMTPERATTVTVEIRTRKQLPERLETVENEAAAALPGVTEGGQGG